MTKVLGLLPAALLVLTACGSEPPPAPEPPPKPEDTIVGEQARVLEQARGLESQLNEAAADRLEEIDRMSVGDDDDDDDDGGP